MTDSRSSTKLSAKDVPVISFAARGTLLHDSPSFEKWCFEYFKAFDSKLDEKALKQIFMQRLMAFNDSVEKAQQMAEPLERLFLRDICEKIFGADQLEKEIERASENHRTSLKIVIPTTTIDVCEELQKRGYRLAIVSNEDSRLLEFLKLYQLLQIFDSVILAPEVGVSKPSPEIFKVLLEDLDLQAKQVVHVGSRYALDIKGAQAAQIKALLYDPAQVELMALNRLEDTSEKVISIEKLRKNRHLQDVRVITQFDQLLEVFG